MAGEIRVAEKATTVLFGGTTAAVISAAVVISTFGSMNDSILAGPRVYYAMAKDGLFFKSVAKIHPKFGTPAFSIVVQAIWASILTLSGTFEQLLTYVIFVSIIFWISAAFAVFTLRKKFPDMPRPYKTWGYPVVPAVFIIASFGILINSLIEKPVESLAGLGITLIGIPVYLYWRSRTGK
jgi:APA family basic amino acid/polyamine antiporter